MAILKSTQIKGDLTVSGSLNVQGDLTYVGVENLRVKDKQIELNADVSGSAASAIGIADEAGIVIRGARTTTQTVDDDASILYDSSDDTLVVNKTIKGTVASANKVTNPLTVNVTDKTGTVKTVKFDGSEAGTVDVNLKDLQDQINSLTGGAAGSIKSQIDSAINALNSNVTAEANGTPEKDGVFVLQSVKIDEKAGKLTSATPTAVEVEQAGAAAAVLGKEGDNSTATTVYGVKAYAKEYADSLASHYAAASHKHAIADVTGLQDELDRKAAKTHTHTIADVTNLQGELDKKQNNLSVDQLNAVNSKITAAKVTGYDKHVADTTTIHVSADDRKKWNAAEQNARNYTNDEIKKLGSAAKKNVLTVAIADSSSDDLVTAAQVKAYAAGVVGAMHFRGAFAENTVISTVILDPASGDVCLVGTKEYVYDGQNWVLFGDEGAYDTKGSATTAETNAKTYADSLNTAMDTRVDALEGKSHTHKNKAELDKIAVGDKANWDDAFAKAHVHDNKTVLDDITAEKVAAWDGAVSAAGVSSVGGKAGALTLKGGSKTLGDVNLSISDGGEISAAIVSNSFDSFGAAAKALTDANAYTDEAKSAVIGNNSDDKDADTIKGAKAYADAVKSEVIGVSGDAANKDTIYGAKAYADAAVSALSSSVAATDATQNGRLDTVEGNINSINSDITSIRGNYVQKKGDTMTGELIMSETNIRMPSNGNNGIVFGNMKIVWNGTDNAIEFIPTTA